MFTPEADSPFIVHKKLHLYRDYFEHNNTEYGYDGITGLMWSFGTENINIIFHSYQAWLQIRHKDLENTVSLMSDCMYRKTNLCKNIEMVTPFLAKKTFNSRLTYYLQELEKGYIAVDKNTKIDYRGNVIQKDKVINIGEAFIKNCVIIGTESKSWGGVQSYSNNPKEIILADSTEDINKRTYSVVGINISNPKYIQFVPEFDFDIISAIVRYFCKSKYDC